MASSTDDDTANWMIVLSDLRTTSYYDLVTLVLLLYDWVIALPREVQMFWVGSPGALSATLYFTNRSVSLLVAGVRVLALVVVSDKACTRINLATLSLKCILNIPPAAFFGLRAYALSQRRMLSFLVFAFCFVPSLTNAVQLKYISSITDPVVGWFNTYDSPLNLNILTVVNRVCVILAILADALVLGITWRLLPPARTFRHRFKLLSGKRLVHVVLRNGAIYSIIMLLLNTSDFICTIYSLFARDTTNLAALNITAMTSAFREYLPPVLVSRFLLDLQEAHQRKVICLSSNCPLDTSHDGSAAGSGIFAPALGVLGATIDWDTAAGRQDANCEEYEYTHRDGDTGSDSGIVRGTFGEGLSPRMQAEQVLSLGAPPTATELSSPDASERCARSTESSGYRFTASVRTRNQFTC